MIRGIATDDATRGDQASSAKCMTRDGDARRGLPLHRQPHLAADDQRGRPPRHGASARWCHRRRRTAGRPPTFMGLRSASPTSSARYLPVDQPRCASPANLRDLVPAVPLLVVRRVARAWLGCSIGRGFYPDYRGGRPVPTALTARPVDPPDDAASRNPHPCWIVAQTSGAILVGDGAAWPSIPRSMMIHGGLRLARCWRPVARLVLAAQEARVAGARRWSGDRQLGSSASALLRRR